EAVYRQTEGNPLFMTEVVRLLVQEDVLTQEGLQNVHMLSGTVHGLSLRIPDGIREVIGNRLNRLSAQCNRILTMAAVVGREFKLEELLCLTDTLTPERVLESLEEAEQERIIEGLPGAVGHYQFTHALIRETLYDEVTAARQMRMHAHVAGVLEAHYGADLEPHVARLAHHFLAA